MNTLDYRNSNHIHVCEVVVARYEENVDWTKHIDTRYRITIYNKSVVPLEISQENISVINNVANVGREAYSYLKYIVDHYEALPDVVAFVQGNPYDNTRFLSISDHEFVKALIEEAERDGISTMTMLPCYETTADYGIDLWYTPVDPSPVRPFGEWFKTFIGFELPVNPLQWIPAAQFAVRKDHIMQHPKSFYIKLMRMIDHHSNPEEVYFLERSWYLIFK